MNTIIYGYFTDERDLLRSVKELQQKGIEISDVRTPFPVHGLDKLLKFTRPQLPKFAFVGGAIGFIMAMGFQIWVSTVGWPANHGGKPELAIPSFVPVTIMLTIIFAALGLALAFLMGSKLGPGADANVLDELVTDDHFQIILMKEKNNLSEQELLDALKATGAIDVKLLNTAK